MTMKISEHNCDDVERQAIAFVKNQPSMVFEFLVRQWYPKGALRLCRLIGEENGYRSEMFDC